MNTRPKADKKIAKPITTLPSGGNTNYIQEAIARKKAKQAELFANAEKKPMRINPAPEHIEPPFKICSPQALMKIIPVVSKALYFTYELHKEYQKNPDGPWVRHAIIDVIAPIPVYGPLFYVAPYIAGSAIALDLLHEPTVEYIDFYENKFSDILNKRQSSSGWAEKIGEGEIFKIYGNLMLANGITFAAHKLLEPAHIAENYINEKLKELHDSGAILMLFNSILDVVKKDVLKFNKSIDDAGLNQFFGVIAGVGTELIKLERPAEMPYMEFCKTLNLELMLEGANKIKVAPFAYKEEKALTTASPQASFQSLLPEFSFARPKPSSLESMTPVETNSDQAQVHERNPVNELALRAPVADTKPVNPDNGKSSELCKFEMSPLRFGEVPGSLDGKDSKRFDGNISIRSDFENGGGVGIGIIIGSRGLGVVAGIDIPTGAGFMAKLAGVATYAVPIGVVIGAGIFLYSNYKKHEAKRTKRHIEGHAKSTQHDLAKARQYLTKMFPELKKMAQLDPVKFDEMIISTKQKLKDYLSELNHRQKYSYKHDVFTFTNWLAQAQRDCKQNALDTIMHLTWCKERGIYEATLVEANKETKLPDLVNKVKPLLNSDHYFKQTYFERIVLKDLIIQRALSNGDYQFLKDNNWLFDKEKQLSPFDLPGLELPEKLESKPRKIDAKHHKHTVTAEVADDVMAKIRDGYKALRNMIESGKDRSQIKAAIKSLVELLDKSKEKLEQIGLKRDDNNTNAYEYNKAVFDSILKYVSTDQPLGSTYDLDLIKKGCDFYLTHQDKSIDELVTLTKSIVDKPNISKQSAKIWATRLLTFDKFYSFMLEGKTPEAILLVNKMSQLSPDEHTGNGKSKKNADISARTIITSELAATLKSTALFCEANKDSTKEFWLKVLSYPGLNLAENQAAETKNVKDSLKAKPQVIQREIPSEARQLLFQMGTHHVEKAAIELSNLGYHALSAETYESFGEVLSKHKIEVTNIIRAGKFQRLSYQAQVLDPAVGAVQGVLEQYVDGLEPSKGKTFAGAALTVAKCTQMVVPNAVTLIIQGVHSSLAGDLATFNTYVSHQYDDFINKMKEPYKHFSSSMLLTQLAVKGFQLLPFDRLRQAQKFVTWASPMGFKISYAANAAHQLVSTSFKAAYRGLHLSTVASAVFDFALIGNHAEAANEGRASESMTQYRIEQGARSSLEMAGAFSVFWLGAATGGIGYLVMGAGAVAVAACAAYNNLSISATKHMAHEVISGAFSNIKFLMKQFKFISEKSIVDSMRAAEVQKVTVKMRASCESIRQSLSDYFDGIRYNESNSDNLNGIKEAYLHYLVFSYHVENNFDEVIKLTERVDSSQNAKESRIHPQIQLPAYLAWPVIEFRLFAIASSENHLERFHQEYESYASAIVHSAPADWLSENIDHVKEMLSRTVKFAVEQFVVNAYSSTDSTRKIIYLESVQKPYQYCKAEELLNNNFKFKAASLAHHMGAYYMCLQFLNMVDFNQLLREIGPNFINVADLEMLSDLKNDDYVNFYNTPARNAVIGEAEIKSHLLYLLDQKKYDLVITSLTKMKDHPGKYYLLAYATYAKSDEMDISATINILLKETNKELSYWQLLLRLINQAYSGLNFIANPIKRNECNLKLLVMLKISADNIQREKVEPALFSSMEAIKLDINDKLKALAPYFLNKSADTITDQELTTWIMNLVDYGDRCMRNVSDLSMFHEIDRVLKLMSYELVNDKKEIQHFIPLTADARKVSVFDVLGKNRLGCIKQLIVSIDTHYEVLLDYMDIVERTTHSREQNRISDNKVIIKKQLDKLLTSQLEIALDKKGICLLKAISRMLYVNLRIYTADTHGNCLDINLSIINNISRPTYIDIFYQSNNDQIFFVKLIPIAERVYEVKTDEIENNAGDQPGSVPQETESKDQLYYNTALSLLKLGKKADAHEYLCKAVAINPKHADALYAHGLLYKDVKGEEAKALDYFKQAETHGNVLASEQILLAQHANDSAQQWHDKGLKFIDGKDKNLSLARVCFENATKSGHVDSLDQLLTLDHPDFTTDKQWHELAMDYFQGGKDVAVNYELARVCFLKVIKLSANHINALYSLGLLYHQGSGVTKDDTIASEYFWRAAELHDINAITYYFKLSHPAISLNTADDWSELASKYDHGHVDFMKDAVKAVLCYKKSIALNPNHTSSLRELGLLYEIGHGVTRSPTDAKNYYDRAIKSGCARSNNDLMRLCFDNYHLLSADEWIALSRRIGDLKKFIPCYENAIRQEPGNTTALYTLARYYEIGAGCEANHTVAIIYYQRAAKLGSDVAKYGLANLCFHDHSLLTIDEWKELGDDLNKNFPAEAIRCYEAVLAKKGGSYHYESASFSLALMYEYGHGVKANKAKAMEYYDRAAGLGKYCKEKADAFRLENTPAPTPTTYGRFTIFGVSFHLFRGSDSNKVDVPQAAPLSA